MSEIISDKNFPIQRIWIYKSILALILMLLAVFTPIYLFYYYGDNKTRCLLEVRSYKYCSKHYSEDRYSNITNSGAIGAKIGFIIFVVPSIFVILILQKKSFHFFIEDKFLRLEQGYFSKEKRYLPYGVIQNISFRQDLLDRIFRISSLIITSASQGGGVKINLQQKGRDELGFVGNKVGIYGLKKKDAEALKNIIIQKMKENPIEDNQSGL